MKNEYTYDQIGMIFITIGIAALWLANTWQMENQIESLQLELETRTDSLNCTIDSLKSEIDTLTWENEIWDFYSTLLNWRKNNSTIHNGNMMQFTSFNDGVYSLFRYDENRIIGLIINPTDKKISIQTNKFDELTINQKYFRDVIDGQKKKWGDKVSIPSVGFRLIEFDL